MESFIYADMNMASRTKDQSKIKFYGAFAAALSFIIYQANRNLMSQQKKKSRDVRLFRGVKMHQLEADQYEADQLINLTGYTSTSKLFSKACKFALFDVKPDQVSVVFEILFQSYSGLFEIGDEFTAYPGE